MEIKPPSELLDYKNKVVLVTGAGSGIGAGIAKRFAQAGADVVICDLKPDISSTGIKDRFGPKAILMSADVSDPEQVKKLFDDVSLKLSPVDVLINNAGIYPVRGLLELSAEEWDRMLAVNLKSVFLCTQAAARGMIHAGKSGAIVNIASIEAINPSAGHSHYAASKAGVVMFSNTAAMELGQYHIRVNSVSPSLINRPTLQKDWPEGYSRFVNKAPLGRVGEPEDVADACLFLASDAARWITGAHLIVDGGILTSQIY
jgi:NAD(P)-dependent dehydrogenase (short-subunit alcohol dehydrogenase family)